jgi:hypothetical protein
MNGGVRRLCWPSQLDLRSVDRSVFSTTAMSETPLSTALDAQIIDCSRCAARLTFTRNYPSRIDACGFEIYSLDCPKCYARLECFIDFTDEALLLSQTGP